MDKATEQRIRKIIREALRGSQPDEMYDHRLMDDEAFSEESTLVPDDIKKRIRKWSESMGL